MSERKVPRCFKCNEIVTFSDTRIGKSGKKIPLDPSTEQPHQCKNGQEARASVVEKMYEEEHPEPQVIEVKEKPGKVPRPIRAMYAIIEHESKKEALRLLTEYVNKYLSYGGQTYGVTYHQDYTDSYTQFFVSYAIPNNAVGEMEQT
jgi:hypothetical protein